MRRSTGSGVADGPLAGVRVGAGVREGVAGGQGGPGGRLRGKEGDLELARRAGGQQQDAEEQDKAFHASNLTGERRSAARRATVPVRSSMAIISEGEWI